MDSSGFGKGIGEALSLLFYFAGAAIIGIPALLVVIGWMWWSEPNYKQQAIDRGYAEYCAKTGDWAWKGECE